jgi:CheY-like chemotaxis protein
MNEEMSLEDFASKERLQRYQTELNGLTGTVRKLLQNLGTYTDFLEEEVEDSPSALNYVNRMQADIQQVGKILNSFDKAHGDDVQEFEKMNLTTLVNGFFSRAQKVRGELDINKVAADHERLIKADLDQLNASLMFLSSLFALDQAFTLEVKELEVNDSQFSTSSLADGRYFAIDLFAGETINIENLSPVMMDSDLFTESGHTMEALYTIGAIKSHKGVLLHSNESGDLAFRLLVPSAGNLGVEGELDDDLSSDSLHGSETILVVDDEDMIWDVLIENLQNLGYIVLLAENGLDAVEIYRENPGEIDLVILDMVMPEMNGREAFHELKKLDDKVKVLISSGYMAENEAGDLMESGALSFLRKPYRMIDLARRIRTLL